MENRRLSQNKSNDIQSDMPIAFSIGENSEDKVEQKQKNIDSQKQYILIQNAIHRVGGAS